MHVAKIKKGAAFYGGLMILWLTAKLDSDRFPCKSYSDITERCAGRGMRVLVTWLVFIHMVSPKHTPECTPSSTLILPLDRQRGHNLPLQRPIPLPNRPRPDLLRRRHRRLGHRRHDPLPNPHAQTLRLDRQYCHLAEPARHLHVVGLYRALPAKLYCCKGGIRCEPGTGGQAEVRDVSAASEDQWSYEYRVCVWWRNDISAVSAARRYVLLSWRNVLTIGNRIIAELRRPLDFLKAFTYAQALIFTIYVFYGLSLIHI